MWPLIALPILMFASDFRMADCWILKNKDILMPQSGNKSRLTPKEYLLLSFIFLYIFTLYLLFTVNYLLGFTHMLKNISL